MKKIILISTLLISTLFSWEWSDLWSFFSIEEVSERFDDGQVKVISVYRPEGDNQILIKKKYYDFCFPIGIPQHSLVREESYEGKYLHGLTRTYDCNGNIDSELNYLMEELDGENYFIENNKVEVHVYNEGSCIEKKLYHINPESSLPHNIGEIIEKFECINECDENSYCYFYGDCKYNYYKYDEGKLKLKRVFDGDYLVDEIFYENDKIVEIDYQEDLEINFILLKETELCSDIFNNLNKNSRYYKKDIPESCKDQKLDIDIDDIKSIQSNYDIVHRELISWYLNIEFFDSRLFSKITENNVGRIIGIFINDELIIAPRINQKIIGEVRISGDFSREEVKEIENQFNSILKNRNKNLD